MALIAIDAVVNVAVYLLVIEVVRVVATVATRALENGIVIGIDVTGRADVVGSAVAGRERRVLRVIEGRSSPGGRVVAVLACRREELRLRRMAWVSRVVVIGLMTSDARSRQRGEVIVHVAVAAYARRYEVGPGQRKCGVVVIES